MLPGVATVVFFLYVLFGAQLPPPDRTVEDHVLTSAHDPKVRVHLPASAHYVGADRWVLYDMADCELYAFVAADSNNNVQRLYWVQFEGYLPSRPELHHTYDSPITPISPEWIFMWTAGYARGMNRCARVRIWSTSLI